MHDDNSDFESFEEMVRTFARELGRSAERITQFDVDGLAETVGIDPDRARAWAETAGKWLRGQVEGMGEDIAARTGTPRTPDPRDTPRQEPPRPSEARRPAAPSPRHEDALRGAAPHPLDLPSDEQGIALGALESGRWFVEPGTHTLSSRGDGPGPSNALGLVRELHAHDWIDADGELTLVGRHALTRWLETTNGR